MHQNAHRAYEVDGLRGWASLSVMLAHLCFGMFLEVQPHFLPAPVRFLLEPPLDGTLDVTIFFVLSSDALSASYWLHPSKHDIARLAIKRYLRLEIPIFASCLIAFALVKFNLTYNNIASLFINDQRWLGSFLQTDWCVSGLLRYSFYGVFFHHVPERSLNPFLGTMRIELLGSILVFIYLGLDRHFRSPAIALILLFLVCLTFNSFLACFPFGLLCGYLRTRGGFARLQRKRGTTALPRF
jgi:peptidoglycan/LPS O-acetylase OafA/YrhL